MGKVKLSYSGIGDMLCSSEMQSDMLRRAKKIRDRAEETAPVGDENDPHRTRFKDSFTATSGVQRRRTRRAYGAVTSDDPTAFHKEMGTSDTPKHRTLGKALRSAGD